jgi:N-acetylneuraminic acid mutarotase
VDKLSPAHFCCSPAAPVSARKFPAVRCRPGRIYRSRQAAKVHHNSWSSKKPLASVLCSGAAAIGTKIYVVGGIDSSLAILSTNQIYDTATNTWSKGKAMPTARWCPGAAVANPKHNSWSEKAPLPISDSPVAVVDGGLIYALGGYSSGSGRLANVYLYNPKANSWTSRQSMKVGRSNPAVGTIGKAIVVADGITNNGVTTETEVYTPQTGRWKVVKANSTARTAGCSSVVNGKLYFAGGELGGGSAPDTNVLEVYDLKTNAWASKASTSQATVAPAFAAVRGLVYCIGGASSGNPNGATFYKDTQVYRP